MSFDTAQRIPWGLIPIPDPHPPPPEVVVTHDKDGQFLWEDRRQSDWFVEYEIKRADPPHLLELVVGGRDPLGQDDNASWHSLDDAAGLDGIIAALEAGRDGASVTAEGVYRSSNAGPNGASIPLGPRAVDVALPTSQDGRQKLLEFLRELRARLG